MPLQKKNNPKAASKEMTDVDKGMIIACFYYGGKIMQVAYLIGHPGFPINRFFICTTKH